LVYIDPYTGIVTQIDTIIGLNDFIMGSSSLDTLNNLFYIVDANNKLISINLNDASIASSQQLSGSVSNLTINTIPGTGKPSIKGDKSENATYRWLDNQEDFLNVSLNQVKAYPNPTTDKLNIEVNNFPTSLSIYDLKGVLIKSEVLESVLTKIDVSEFENGLYFFILSNSDVTETKKIIVK